MANYRGFPLILGGWAKTGLRDWTGLGHNKLEMLNTIENSPRWVEYEGTDYPYSEE